MAQFNFPKEERLTHRKAIKELFAQARSSSSFLYPYKLIFCKVPDETWRPPQILVSVPKKKFKHAVVRNRIKRQTKEAYRLHKHQLKTEQSLHLAFLYVGKKEHPTTFIFERMERLLQQFNASQKMP